MDAQTLNVPTHPTPRPHRRCGLVPIPIHEGRSHELERVQAPRIITPFSSWRPSPSSVWRLFTHHQSVMASAQPSALLPPSPRIFPTVRTAFIPHGDVRVRRRVDGTREPLPTASAATTLVTAVGDTLEAGRDHRRAGARGRR